MGAPPGGPLPADYTDLHTAPEHVVDLLAGNLPARPGGAAGRDLARQLADRIWAEAAHRGAVWGMSRATTTIHVTTDQLDRLKEWPQAVNNP